MTYAPATLTLTLASEADVELVKMLSPDSKIKVIDALPLSVIAEPQPERCSGPGALSWCWTFLGCHWGSDPSSQMLRHFRSEWEGKEADLITDVEVLYAGEPGREISSGTLVATVHVARMVSVERDGDRFLVNVEVRP